MGKAIDIHQQASSFLKRYYARLNGKARNLKSLYDPTSEVTWPDSNGAMFTLQSVDSIEGIFEEMPTRPQYEVTHFEVQRISGGLFILCHGLRTDSDSSCMFMQSFNLHKKGEIFVVTNDIMLLKETDATDQANSVIRADIQNRKGLATMPASSTDHTTCTLLAKSVTGDTQFAQGSSLAAPIEVGHQDSGRSTLQATPTQSSAEPSECSRKYSVCIITDKKMEEHKPEYFCTLTSHRMMKRDFKSTNPEVPERLESIMTKLQEDKILERVTVFTPDLADHTDVSNVHADNYLGFVNDLPMSKNKLAKFKNFYNSDMFCSAGTPAASYLAAGAVVQACDLVANRKFESAFAIVRPPGHHASKEKAEGYCFLNNVAIGAEYLLKKLGLTKIMVVDFDVHHCNGTQKIFYERNDVLVFSTFCPTLGYPDSEEMRSADIGSETGKGYNINVPLVQGFGNADLLYVWKKLLLPLAKQFSPEQIIVSAGFDAAEGDVGQCNVTSECYPTLVDELVELGCPRGVVLALEGGYNLDVLPKCAANCVRALLGEKDLLLDRSEAAAPDKRTIETVEQLIGILSLSGRWKF